MKKIYFSILLIAVSVAASHAQMRFGIEGGANMDYASMGSGSGSVAGISSKVSPDIGYFGGAFLDFSASDNFGVQLGAYYTILGYKYEYSYTVPGASSSTDFSETVNESFIRVPLNLVVKTGIGGGAFFINGGGFLGYGIGGTIKAAGVSTSFSYSDNGGSPLFFGACGGVGYELPMGLFIRGAYYLNLGAVKNGAVGSVTENSVNVSLGYIFGGGGGSGKHGGRGRRSNSSGLNLPKYKDSHSRPWNFLANP